jgi:hypothetical protein
MFLAHPCLYLICMDRHAKVMVILSLFLSSGFLLVPVQAVDNAGPDTSGFDLDISGTIVEVLDKGPMALIDPPRWQWDAERSKAEADRCAAECKSLNKEYLQGVEAFRLSGKYFTPSEQEHCKNPANRLFCEGKARSYDDKVDATFNKLMDFCECARKNYNSAMALTDKKDYEGQAIILESAEDLYATLEMTKEQERVRNLALGARAAAAAQSIFLPLPAWIAACGLIGGLLLIQRKRK